jgi:hypothetical protein
MIIKSNFTLSIIQNNPMQKFSLLFSFLWLSTSLFGQTKPDKTQILGDSRIETYFFKATNYDSLRLTIKGKTDTVLEEKLWRNGHFSTRTWGTDSIHDFNSQGLIQWKKYRLTIYQKTPHYNIQEADSTVSFYADGSIKSIERQ